MSNSGTERLGRFFWVLALLVTTANALSWYWHSLEFIAREPRLEAGYHQLILGFVVWANIPWVVMGVSCTTQKMTLQDYLEPQSINTHLITFFFSVLIVLAAGTYWLFGADGAEILVQYPGLLLSESGKVLNSQDLDPQLIKVIWGVSVASTVLAIIFMLIKVSRSHSESS
jgi:hypothetical protein